MTETNYTKQLVLCVVALVFFMLGVFVSDQAHDNSVRIDKSVNTPGTFYKTVVGGTNCVIWSVKDKIALTCDFPTTTAKP